MKNIGDLIVKMCPKGVQSARLADIAEIKRGERITKKDLCDDGLFPVISGGISPMGFYDKANRKKNTITIASYGTAGYVDFQNRDFWANDVCLCVYPKIEVNNIFLYYSLCHQQEYIFANTTKAIPDHIPTKFLENMLIPLPPIEVQNEIVRILDTFNELNNGLQKEINERNNQFVEYKDKLISCLDDSLRVPLCRIAKGFYKGSGISKEQIKTDGYPCVRYGELYTTYKLFIEKCVSHIDENEMPSKKYINYGDILFTITSESIEDIATSVAYLGEERCLVGGDLLVMTHDQNPEYLAYALSTYEAFKQKIKGKVKSKVVHTKQKDIEDIVIPIPDKDIQAGIVRVLNCFNENILGLTKELQLRRVQFEYYRDKLLTFNELT